MQLTTDKKARKEQPIARGFMDYFPNAIAEVAHVSYVGNQQHNPGQELHWSRGKSDDHADCIARHLIERGTVDEDGVRHSAKAAWRALAMLQLELEAQAKLPSPGKAAYSDEASDPTQPAVIKQASASALELAYRDRHRDVAVTGTFPHAYQFVGRQARDFKALVSLGCPEKTAMQVIGGTTYNTHNTDLCRPEKYAYVAGPMRGYDKFNFPAFDAARDRLLDKGYHVISPADIDRFDNPVNADDTKVVDTSDQTVFILRDFYALFFMRKLSNRNAIALLPNWFNSTGATGEFFMARWLGLHILTTSLDMMEQTPETLMHDFALRHVVSK